MNREEWREKENMYACWICNFPGIGNKQLHRLWELCGGFEAMYFASREKWGRALSEKQVESLAAYTAKWHPEEECRKMREEGIMLVTVWDENYPERLKSIPDAPCFLFVRGKLPAEGAPAIAIIGARECSEYGKYVARQLGGALGGAGAVVISGMAKGIDGISQDAALEAGGSSVGVLGSGVDVCYPAQNKGLYGRLQKNGAVLSPYPMGTPARAQNFPPRNRIVSGLADAVVVIEARVKSGTLITVDMALEQGREVYAVPGRVTDRPSDGCNRLIKQGANVLLDLDEFIGEIWELSEGKLRGRERVERGGEQAEQRSDRQTGHGADAGQGRLLESGSRLADKLPAEFAAVYKALDFNPRSLEEIRPQLSGKFQDKQIIACLMRLCMENLAFQVSPGHFCRKI